MVVVQTSSNTKYSVDLRELICPMSLLIAKKALSELPDGHKLSLKVADEASCRDILRYARKFNYQLLEEISSDTETTLIIIKDNSLC